MATLSKRSFTFTFRTPKAVSVVRVGYTLDKLQALDKKFTPFRSISFYEAEVLESIEDGTYSLLKEFRGTGLKTIRSLQETQFRSAGKVKFVSYNISLFWSIGPFTQLIFTMYPRVMEDGVVIVEVGYSGISSCVFYYSLFNNELDYRGYEKRLFKYLPEEKFLRIWEKSIEMLQPILRYVTDNSEET